MGCRTALADICIYLIHVMAHAGSTKVLSELEVLSHRGAILRTRLFRLK